MMDISKLGDEVEKRQLFPPFDKAVAGMPTANGALSEVLSSTSLRDAMSEALKVDRAFKVDKTIKEAVFGKQLGNSTVVAGLLRDIAAPFGEGIDKQLQESLKSALGGSLDAYYKSRNHVQDVFGSKALADEMSRLSNSSPTIGKIGHMEEFGRALPDHFTPHDFPKISPNPIHETNEHLAGLGGKIDALVDLQAKQADVIDKLLQAQIANEAAQEHTDKRAYRLAVINTVLATILALGAIVVTIMVAR